MIQFRFRMTQTLHTHTKPLSLLSLWCASFSAENLKINDREATTLLHHSCWMLIARFSRFFLSSYEMCVGDIHLLVISMILAHLLWNWHQISSSMFMNYVQNECASQIEQKIDFGWATKREKSGVESEHLSSVRWSFINVG